ncbi:hypothetical protein GUITHDRAFT_154574 [Guillardia theta CCMP2712]|uniref:Uncharacterized protein n=2 Tax=Guillardia theta TaxID=55529 RepID=L1IS23_GUITC|nr:hypothetical protein GUITHDRAFT_154574 [Guillardia theta CCMP2712]EKX38877.1 hypothetical protein GUITHDRAFT_154574 [Guillardia theta CCMP2712]|mmetsp:Transcript_43969/g.138789  ORF Transcript_43969/g.138789 Transcript_43969/m.138789 type:complete len:231 (+) Transcript_43969:102-794(+)|eukprot:XP_005825857.1 hypothetical protein GUITHDRAFT_154574 [Guillardia theta CCMP2712]
MHSLANVMLVGSFIAASGFVQLPLAPTSRSSSSCLLLRNGQPLSILPNPRSCSSVAMQAKKKGKKVSSSKTKAAPSSPDATELYSSSSSSSESVEDVDADVSVKKLIRDRSLESLIEDIPKAAIVNEPKWKRKKDKEEEKEADIDAAFGLSGDMMRMIKNGTWACIALLVLLEVYARSPLAGDLRLPDAEERAIQVQRQEQAKEGKILPGVRPWAPFGLNAPADSPAPSK